MQPYNNVSRKLHQIIVNNFLGGIAWGLGATIGLSIIVAIFGLILNKINLIPIAGNFISQVIEFIQKNQGLPK